MSAVTDFEIRFDETPRPADSEVNVLYNKALMHILREEFEAASKVLGEILQKDPSDKDAPILAIKVFIKRNKPFDAMMMVVGASRAGIYVTPDLFAHVLADGRRAREEAVRIIDASIALEKENARLRSEKSVLDGERLIWKGGLFGFAFFVLFVVGISALVSDNRQFDRWASGIFCQREHVEDVVTEPAATETPGQEAVEHEYRRVTLKDGRVYEGRIVTMQYRDHEFLRVTMHSGDEANFNFYEVESLDEIDPNDAEFVPIQDADNDHYSDDKDQCPNGGVDKSQLLKNGCTIRQVVSTVGKDCELQQWYQYDKNGTSTILYTGCPLAGLYGDVYLFDIEVVGGEYNVEDANNFRLHPTVNPR